MTPYMAVDTDVLSAGCRRLLSVGPFYVRPFAMQITIPEQSGVAAFNNTREVRWSLTPFM